jgi:hypothetical protein
LERLQGTVALNDFNLVIRSVTIGLHSK